MNSLTFLDKLNALVDKFGYEETGKRLGYFRKDKRPYTYSYIHQIISEKLATSDFVRTAIDKEWVKLLPPVKPPKPRVRRLRIEVYFDSEEDYQFARGLGAGERARRLSAQ